MSDAIRVVRIFSAIAVITRFGACLEGNLTGDTVPVVLGVTAAACGVILAVFASLAHRKTRA